MSGELGAPIPPLARRLRRRRRPGRPIGGPGLLLVALLIAATAAVGLAAIARDPTLVLRCSLDAEHPRRVPNTSFMTAADGTRLGALPAPRHREPVPLRRMSRWLPLATVAIEDRRFWQHGALDYQAILRAAWVNLRLPPAHSAQLDAPV